MSGTGLVVGPPLGSRPRTTSGRTRSAAYLGVHYRFDAVDGNATGMALGHTVAKRLLRVRHPADFDGDGRIVPPDLIVTSTPASPPTRAPASTATAT